MFCSHVGMDYWNPLWWNQCYHRVAGCTLRLQAMMKEIKTLWRRCVGYGDRTGNQPRYIDHKGFGPWSRLKELGSSTSMNIIRFALAMFCLFGFVLVNICYILQGFLTATWAIKWSPITIVCTCHEPTYVSGWNWQITLCLLLAKIYILASMLV